MAIDSFLKVGTLKGESVVKGFEDQIQILSWSWGMNQTGSTHSGTGSGTGKIDVHDLGVIKYVDAASPTIALACCKGTHFDSAVLTIRKAGGTALEYLTLTLTDVIITSYSVQASDGDERIKDTVALNFGKYKYSYQPQDNKGAKKGGAIDATYDIAKLVDA
jgi:type VI secretion system secreted protein Hcp